jgi:hypothetical protein
MDCSIAFGIGVRQLLLAALLTFACIGTTNAAQYKGEGGQIEAFGKLSADYVFGLKILAICEKYPRIRAEVAAAGNAYRERNKPLYEQLTARIYEIASFEFRVGKLGGRTGQGRPQAGRSRTLDAARQKTRWSEAESGGLTDSALETSDGGHGTAVRAGSGDRGPVGGQGSAV